MSIITSMELPNDAKVFADSNYFISLFNPADSNNAKATELFHQLQSQQAVLIASNLIFAEVVTILSQRQNRASALGAGEHLFADPQITMIHVDSELHHATWEVFRTIEKKNVSFVDCSIIAIMQAENIKSLLTFDRTDFATMRKRYHFKFFE